MFYKTLVKIKCQNMGEIMLHHHSVTDMLKEKT